jgi:hypothetical protein
MQIEQNNKKNIFSESFLTESPKVADILLSYCNYATLSKMAKLNQLVYKSLYKSVKFFAPVAKIVESGKKNDKEDLVSSKITIKSLDLKNKIIDLSDLVAILQKSGLEVPEVLDSKRSQFPAFKNLVNNNLISLVLNNETALDGKISKLAAFAPILYDINAINPSDLLIEKLKQTNGGVIDLPTQQKLLKAILDNYQKTYDYQDSNLIDYHIKNVFLKNQVQGNLPNSVYNVQQKHLKISYSVIGNSVWVQSPNLRNINHLANLYYNLTKDGRNIKWCEGGTLNKADGTALNWLSFNPKDLHMFKSGLVIEGCKADEFKVGWYKKTGCFDVQDSLGNSANDIIKDRADELIAKLTEEQTRFIFMIKESLNKVEELIYKNNLKQNDNLKLEFFDTVDGSQHLITKYCNNLYGYNPYIYRPAREGLQKDLSQHTGELLPLGIMHTKKPAKIDGKSIQEFYKEHPTFIQYVKEQKMAPEFAHLTVNKELAALIEKELVHQGLRITEGVDNDNQLELVKNTNADTVTFTFFQSLFKYMAEVSSFACQELALPNAQDGQMIQLVHQSVDQIMGGQIE